MNQGKRDEQIEGAYRILFCVVIGIVACIIVAFLTGGAK